MNLGLEVGFAWQVGKDTGSILPAWSLSTVGTPKEEHGGDSFHQELFW